MSQKSYVDFLVGSVMEGIKKASKGGLEYQLMQRKKPIYFIVDSLSIEPIANKEGSYGNSITASELRWLHRNRNIPEVRQNLHLIGEQGEVSIDEFFSRPEWQEYASKRFS